MDSTLYTRFMESSNSMKYRDIHVRLPSKAEINVWINILITGNAYAILTKYIHC